MEKTKQMEWTTQDVIESTKQEWFENYPVPKDPKKKRQFYTQWNKNSKSLQEYVLKEFKEYELSIIQMLVIVNGMMMRRGEERRTYKKWLST